MSLDQDKINQFLQDNQDAIENEDWDSVFLNVANRGIFENGRRVLNLTEDEWRFVIYLLLDNLNIQDIFNSIKRIPNGMFNGVAHQSLKHLVLPCNIGDTSFEATNVETLTIDGDIEWGSKSFFACKSLSEVTIKSDNVNIPMSAFYRCTSLKKVNIPNTAKDISISGYAFKFCTSLESIDISSASTVFLGTDCFIGCKNLKHLSLPNKVDYGGYCFVNCDNLVIDYDGTQEEWDEITANEADFSEYPVKYKVNCLRK